MELISIVVGVAIGLGLAALGLTGSKLLTWAEAKIKLIEAQTASHAAVAAVTNARATVIAQAVAASPVKASVTGPTGA